MSNPKGNAKGKRIAEMVRCPVKGCKHQGEMITVNHFRTAHGFTGTNRAEAIAQFGAPIPVEMDLVKLQENRRMNDIRSSMIYS